jgi:hypothetical protein
LVPLSNSRYTERNGNLKKGTMGEAATESAKHGLVEWLAEGTIRGPRHTLDRARARLPFTPALLAKAHLFGEVRARLGVIRRDHRIIGRQAPFLAVFVR